jgi:hypothetical protein
MSDFCITIAFSFNLEITKHFAAIDMIGLRNPTIIPAFQSIMSTSRLIDFTGENVDS